MNLSPLDPSRVAGDTTLFRVRRCRKCGGAMRCKSLVELRVNQGYAGRDYTFVCEGCKHHVTELSGGRVAYLGSVIVFGGGLGVLLVTYGVEMLVHTITHGPGGNDLSALIVVLVLFLGLGTPFLLWMLWSAKSLVSDWLELRRNPVVGSEAPDASRY